MSTSRRGDLPKSQKELRATTAERLEAIVEAAERAAESVIDDAEAQARRYLAQARAEADRITDKRMEDLSHMIDVLLERADALQREAERMQRLLEEAKSRIGPEPPAGAQKEAPAAEEAAPLRDAPRLRAVTHAEQPAPPPEVPQADAAGARLLATQMAVSGSSREEIEARLRNRFEIEDTTPILDAILGPED
jgi:predicted house-cleaning noncanonical NTP pyrophosphatase (MazG superfamily)